MTTVQALFSWLGSAIRVTDATEAHRAPAAADLQALGIEPAQFETIIR